MNERITSVQGRVLQCSDDYSIQDTAKCVCGFIIPVYPYSESGFCPTCGRHYVRVSSERGAEVKEVEGR